MKQSVSDDGGNVLDKVELRSKRKSQRIAKVISLHRKGGMNYEQQKVMLLLSACFLYDVTLIHFVELI